MSINMDNWIENLHITHPHLEPNFIIHLRREWPTMPENEKRGTVDGLTPNRSPDVLDLNDFEQFPTGAAQDAAFAKWLKEVDAEFQAFHHAPQPPDTPAETPTSSSTK